MAYIVATMPTYFAHDWQVSINEKDKWEGGDYFLIFQPSRWSLASPLNKPLHLDKTIMWTLNANLYVRFKDLKHSWPKYEQVMSSLTYWFFSNPGLSFNGNTYVKWCLGTNLIPTADPVFWFKNKAESVPNFIYQTLRFTITQKVSFPLSVTAATA
jgi:hypothetical protein